MKKTNKKGFTIVELVIVIAVIAILAGVLIPTFSNVVKKANESSVLQSARNCYTMLLAEVNGTPSSIVAGTLTSAITADSGVTSIEVTQAESKTTAIKFTTAKGYVTYTIATNTWGAVTVTP